MHSSIDPPVSLFISKIRRIKGESKGMIILNELKKLARMDASDDHFEIQILWKKLYLLNSGAKITPMDFVKAVVSPNPEIKSLGYLGMSLCNIGERMILLQHTIEKDLNDNSHHINVLGFLATARDQEKTNHDILMTMAIPKEGSDAYLRYIIARGRYDSRLFFSLVSPNERTLYVKIQVILDNGLESKLDTGEIKWLVSKTPAMKCLFLRLKTLNLLQRLHAISRLPIEDSVIQHLKALVVNNVDKMKREIEMALAIESMKLLVATGNTHEKLEELVFRLINSSSLNLQFLGLKHAFLFHILPEISIGVIFRCGIDRKMHFDALMKLVSRSNFRNVYRRLNELRQIAVSGNAEMMRRESRIEQLLLRLCELGDQEFICRLLYENPGIYRTVRHRGIISREQCKEFFKMVVQSTVPEHFLLVYDLFPKRSKSPETVAELGLSHAMALLSGETERQMYAWSNMVDFLCTHGNPKLNRDYLLNGMKQEKTPNLDVLMRYIETFNIVVDERMLYVGNGQFIRYWAEDTGISIAYPEDVEYLQLESEETLTSTGSRVENGEVIQRYEVPTPVTLEIELRYNGKRVAKSIYLAQAQLN